MNHRERENPIVNTPYAIQTHSWSLCHSFLGIPTLHRIHNNSKQCTECNKENIEYTHVFNIVHTAIFAQVNFCHFSQIYNNPQEICIAKATSCPCVMTKHGCIMNVANEKYSCSPCSDYAATLSANSEIFPIQPHTHT